MEVLAVAAFVCLGAPADAAIRRHDSHDRGIRVLNNATDENDSFADFIDANQSDLIVAAISFGVILLLCTISCMWNNKSSRAFYTRREVEEMEAQRAEAEAEQERVHTLSTNPLRVERLHDEWGDDDTGYAYRAPAVVKLGPDEAAPPGVVKLGDVFSLTALRKQQEQLARIDPEAAELRNRSTAARSTATSAKE